LAQYVQGGIDQLIPPRQYLLGFRDMSVEEVDAIEKEVGEGFKAEEETGTAPPPEIPLQDQKPIQENV